MLIRQWVFVAAALLARSLHAGNEFPVNQTTALDQERPALAQLTNGNVVIAWESETGAASAPSQPTASTG